MTIPDPDLSRLIAEWRASIEADACCCVVVEAVEAFREARQARGAGYALAASQDSSALSDVVVDVAESDKVEKRRHDVEHVKAKEGYQSYLAQVPREERTADMPHTPRCDDLSMSTRKRRYEFWTWNKQLLHWL